MPYDIAGALQNPNIIGNALAAGRLGRADGLAAQAQQKQNALASLAGQAYTAPAEQQNALVGQMVGIDPGAGMAMGDALGSRAQAQEVDHNKRLGGAARYMAQALQSKNPAKIEGAWQAVRPYLAEVSGKEPPQQWDPAMEPALYQAIAATGGTPDVTPKVLSPGAALVGEQGKVLYKNPYGYQYQDVPMGQGEAAGAFDRNTGMVRPATSPEPQGGPQAVEQGDPMQPFIDQANAAIQMGAPQDQVEAWLLQQAQQMGMQPQASEQDQAANDGGQVQQPTQPQGQFGIGTPKPSGSQNLIEQRAAQVQALKSRGVSMTQEEEQQYLMTGKPGINFQGAGTANAFGNADLSGSEYLQSIPTSEQDVVRGILNGTKQLPTGSALKSPYWQSVMTSVMHADPSWNEAAYKQYAATRRYFTDGKGGKLINNINTAMQHASELLETIKAMDNHDTQVLNRLGNYVSTQTGGQDVTNFNAVVTPLASELASVYKNGNAPTDQETEEWRNMLSANMSKGQQLNVLRRWIDLLAGKMNATRAQYQHGMSNLAEPLTVVSPDAKEAMARIANMSDQFSGQPNPAAQTLGNTPIYAPGGDVPRGTGAPTQGSPAGGVDDLLSKYGVQ